MHGVDRRYIQVYLDEYMWRQNNNLSRTTDTAILQAIAKVYPINNTTMDLDKIFEIPVEWLQEDNDCDEEIVFDKYEPDGVYRELVHVNAIGHIRTI